MGPYRVVILFLNHGVIYSSHGKGLWEPLFSEPSPFPGRQAWELYSLQLSGMTFKAKGTRSSKEASRITALMSG